MRYGQAKLRMIGAFAAAALAGAACAETSDALLLKSVFRLGVGAQVAGAAEGMCEGAGEAVTLEVEDAVSDYRASVEDAIRRGLEAKFGESARDKFGRFVERYTQAESDGDSEYLAELVGKVGSWESVPESYAALREAVVGDMLAADVKKAGEFFADVQTWLDLRKKSQGVPSLRIWMNRGLPEATAVAAAGKPKAKPDPLRDAEAVAEGDVEVSGGGSAAGRYGAAREERRRKALEEARAGMQQVAEERRAAEDEESARVAAAAQAEADAVRKQAEKLAAAEAEAIEQRRNSWSGRLKSVLTTTIAATGGAFFGTVGERAGKAAAESVFNADDDWHRRRR